MSELELSKIANSTELSLIDLIKVKNEALHYLTLDIGSNIFYTNQEFKFGKYNPFFQLLCSGVGGYSRLDTLKLTNFELFDYLRHDDVHKDVDSWIEPPTDNFETFMEYVADPALDYCATKVSATSQDMSQMWVQSSSWIKYRVVDV